jgi:hypothetical protein
LQKVGQFLLALAPGANSAVLSTTSSVAFNSSATTGSLVGLGLGLLATDIVVVQYYGTTAAYPQQAAQTAGVGLVGAFVSTAYSGNPAAPADAITITWGNFTAGNLTPASGYYAVTVYRVDPNFNATNQVPALGW